MPPKSCRTSWTAFLPRSNPSAADLVVRLLCSAALQLSVYVNGKNIKKYHHGTERLTMNSLLKDPKTVWNKNVLWTRYHAVVNPQGKGGPHRPHNATHHPLSNPEMENGKRHIPAAHHARFSSSKRRLPKTERRPDAAMGAMRKAALKIRHGNGAVIVV